MLGQVLRQVCGGSRSPLPLPRLLRRRRQPPVLPAAPVVGAGGLRIRDSPLAGSAVAAPCGSSDSLAHVLPAVQPAARHVGAPLYAFILQVMLLAGQVIPGNLLQSSMTFCMRLLRCIVML